MLGSVDVKQLLLRGLQIGVVIITILLLSTRTFPCQRVKTESSPNLGFQMTLDLQEWQKNTDWERCGNTVASSAGKFEYNISSINSVAQQ